MKNRVELIERIEIILVDDNQHDADLLISTLNKSYLINQVVHITNGPEAIDYILGTNKFANRKVENSNRIILLSIEKSNQLGIDLLAKIKANQSCNKIPVIILCSSKDDVELKNCLSLGVANFLIKPITIEAFTKVMHELGLQWLLINKSASTS